MTVYKRLKIRITLMAAVALSVSLFLFATVLNSAFYVSTDQQVETVLDTLSANDGELTYNTATFEKLGENSVDSLYQYRYFSLTLDRNKELLSYSTSHIHSVDNRNFTDILKDILAKNKNRGRITVNKVTFSYRQIHLRDGKTLLVFLDSSRFYRTTRRMSLFTYLLSIISLVIFLGIFWLFSGRIIRPFIRNREKQQRFVTNAGHELKTPLAIIQANTELQELMTGENEWSTSTKDQVTRMTNLINSMVALARLEEQPDLALSDIDLSAVTEDAAEDFKGPVVRDGKEFVMDINPNIHIKAEEKSIFELVTVLVDNANKYCDKGGTVSVRLSQIGHTRKRARLQISNTYKAGKGVDYSKFFERFYREDESHNNKKQSGFGIGLSMAQSVVHLFKGQIFASYKGDTITFSVIFPK